MCVCEFVCVWVGGWVCGWVGVCVCAGGGGGAILNQCNSDCVRFSRNKSKHVLTQLWQLS